TFRWSQRQSILILEHLRGSDRVLALWMSDGGRPEAAPPAIVRVLIGDRELAALRVTHGFHEYDVEIPVDVAASAAASGEPIRVALRTDTWNPLRTIGAPDPRDL